MKHLFILFVIVLAGCSDSKPVFKIVSYIDSKPLRNRKVVLYNGDVRFKLRRGTNPYPYNATNKTPHLLDILKTNNSGLLKLNKTYNCRSITFVFGEPYRNIGISFSKNLNNIYSKNHIRICAFIAGSTRVKGNYIYDLKGKKVTYYPIDGKETVKEFKFITLQTDKQPARVKQNR